MSYVLKIYSPDIQYAKGDCIERGEKYYVHNGSEFVPLIVDDANSPWNESGPPGPPGESIKGDKGEPGESIKGEPGKSIQFAGEWSPRTTYSEGQAVQYRGNLFIALQENRSRRPTPDGNAYWGLAVKRGLRGRTGEQGQRGFIGPRGFRGSSAEQQQSETVTAQFLNSAPKGSPIYIADTDTGAVDLATASGSFSQASVAGLSMGDGTFSPDSIIDQSDWSQVLESAESQLQPGAFLFLSSVAGKLTYTSPQTGYSVQVARAVSKTAVNIEIQYPILLD